MKVSMENDNNFGYEKIMSLCVFAKYSSLHVID